MSALSQRAPSAANDFAAELLEPGVQETLLPQLVRDTGFAIANLRQRELVAAAAFFALPTARAPGHGRRVARLACVLPGNGPLYTLAKILSQIEAVAERITFRLPTRLRESHRLITELVGDHYPHVEVHYDVDPRSGAAYLRDAFHDPSCPTVIAFGSDAWIDGVVDDAATTRTRLIFEGPGNDPAIVLPGADLRRAAADIAMAGAANGGQSCSAIKRIYVHRDVLGGFVDALCGAVSAIRCGDPLDPAVQVTPLRGAALRERVLRQLHDATERGARRLFGSGALDPGGLFAPTVLLATDDMAVVREETFYPVYPVVPFATTTEVLGYVEGSPYGLNAALFGPVPDELAAAVRAGHKWTFFDQTAITPGNLATHALVGGYKRSAFITEPRGDRFLRRHGCFRVADEVMAP